MGISRHSLILKLNFVLMCSVAGLLTGNELRPALCGVANTVNQHEGTRRSASDSGQRDLVNFPELKRPIYSSPTRHGFIPEAAFQFFYKKTGVSGKCLPICSCKLHLLSGFSVMISILPQFLVFRTLCFWRNFHHIFAEQGMVDHGS